jgi:signal peptidase I
MQGGICMDRIRDYISLILNEVNIDSVKKNQLEEELKDHLYMAKKELITEGYSDEEAEIEAIRSFGEPHEIAKRFRKVFSPFRILVNALSEKRIMSELAQWAVMIAAALIISLSVRSYAFAQTQVRQTSMQNTLVEGQRLFENKTEYYNSAPERGDIVVINREMKKGVLNIFIYNTKEFFESFYKNNEDEETRLIKRVIGTPGDEIDIRGGRVYINGNIYNEPYVKGVTFPNSMKFPVIVPEEKYFVMGDNREASLDSRDLGFISIDNIEGKALYRLWPFNKLGNIYE